MWRRALALRRSCIGYLVLGMPNDVDAFSRYACPRLPRVAFRFGRRCCSSCAAVWVFAPALRSRAPVQSSMRTMPFLVSYRSSSVSDNRPIGLLRLGGSAECLTSSGTVLSARHEDRLRSEMALLIPLFICSSASRLTLFLFSFDRLIHIHLSLFSLLPSSLTHSSRSAHRPPGRSYPPPASPSPPRRRGIAFRASAMR